MSKDLILVVPNLQLFAEGSAGSGSVGDGGTGAAATQADNTVLATPRNKAKNPLADVIYGKQEDVQQPIAENTQVVEENTTDRKAQFEKFKNENKDLFDSWANDTIQKRLKGSKETLDRYNELSPTLELLGKKYGVDPTDVKALSKAIEDDESFYEKEAMEKGISVEELKSIRKMEAENAFLKRQNQERQAKENADRIYAGWLQQAEQTKTVYPSFDLNVELQNKRFVDLLRANIPVRTAYEVMHKDEIIPAAMQFTAQKVGEQYANKVIANGARPNENGINSNSTAVVKSDVSQLSKDDRREIIRRAQRGEKISF